MTVTIKCTTPKGFEITIPFYDYDPDSDLVRWFEDLLSFDNALAGYGFKPMPTPKSGGGWNKGGNTSTPRNWIDVKDNTIYIYYAFVESKEKSAEIRKAWGDKLKEATGISPNTDKETFGQDAKGYAIYTYTYPTKYWAQIVGTLPESEFEYRPTFKARVEQALKKDK